MRRQFALKAVITFFLLVALASCGPPWEVVLQAHPNPLIGQRSFTVQPVDFTGLRVGAKTEQGYLSEKDQDQVASWREDKLAMNDSFASELIGSARDEGIQVVPPSQPTAFFIYPRVDWIEPGFYAVVAARSSEVRMTVRITDQGGQLIDEIALAHATGASLTSPSIGGRLRSDAAALGGFVAEYLASRVSPEED